MMCTECDIFCCKTKMCSTLLQSLMSLHNIIVSPGTLGKLPIIFESAVFFHGDQTDIVTMMLLTNGIS